jgi:hypothetical protein
MKSPQSWSISLPTSSITKHLIKTMCEKQTRILFSFTSCKTNQLLKLQVNGLRVYEKKIKKTNLYGSSFWQYLSYYVSVFDSLPLLLSAPQFPCFLFQPTVFYSSSVSQSLSLCVDVESDVFSPSVDENFWQLFIVVPFEFNTTHSPPSNTWFHTVLLIRPSLLFCLSAMSISKIKSFVEF